MLWSDHAAAVLCRGSASLRTALTDPCYVVQKDLRQGPYNSQRILPIFNAIEWMGGGEVTYLTQRWVNLMLHMSPKILQDEV